MKTVDEQRKAISGAISRAYGVNVYPVEIGTEFSGKDPREFVKEYSGKPHADVTVQKLGAIALSRTRLHNGDDALASTIADLVDGGISLDRQAAAPRNLEQSMAKHRAKRARENPLPSDLLAKARRDAPTVVRRGGGSAFKKPAPPPPPPPNAARITLGTRVKYRRLDDESEHDVVLGRESKAASPGSPRMIAQSSPLGRALVGATHGTIVSAQLGADTVEIEVLSVG
ncbi:MAG TPA: GreA/GreB family elongation factor [Polyangiaceae bacterium]|nr:GreA/GreB family elongation factor [Polyangiaceae bacterium]